jgi:DNA-binding transcriptional LysR family regulator
LQSLFDIEICDLMYLEASAAAGNFTRAAKALGINTSTISRRVGRFEDELGLALFERGHAGVRLTSGGRAVLPHIQRALAELDAIRHAGDQNGNGIVGEVRLGVRMPPIGEPLRSLLAGWRAKHPGVGLTIAEMNEWEMQAAIQERRVDVALMTSHTLWPDAVTAPLYRERILAALPCDHPLAEQKVLDWARLRKETFLVQGWDNSQSALAFYASFMGCGVKFQCHAASKQSVSGSSPLCAMRPSHAGFSELGLSGRARRGVTSARRSFAKARSVAMKRASMGPISFAGSTVPWPVSRPSAFPYATRSR